jgi:hypothetical protein
LWLSNVYMLDFFSHTAVWLHKDAHLRYNSRILVLIVVSLGFKSWMIYTSWRAAVLRVA